MLTPIATLLAFAGTGLTAIAVFAPHRARDATVSFAPPLDVMSPEPLPVERWAPAPDAMQTETVEPSLASEPPRWPALVDARADGSEIAVRLALIEAFAALATPWADEMLERARDEEADPQVRAAATAARRDAGA